MIQHAKSWSTSSGDFHPQIGGVGFFLSTVRFFDRSVLDGMAMVFDERCR